LATPRAEIERALSYIRKIKRSAMCS